MVKITLKKVIQRTKLLELWLAYAQIKAFRLYWVFVDGLYFALNQHQALLWHHNVPQWWVA